jgi:hypothetical protein
MLTDVLDGPDVVPIDVRCIDGRDKGGHDQWEEDGPPQNSTSNSVTRSGASVCTK